MKQYTILREVTLFREFTFTSDKELSKLELENIADYTTDLDELDKNWTSELLLDGETELDYVVIQDENNQVVYDSNED